MRLPIATFDEVCMVTVLEPNTKYPAGSSEMGVPPIVAAGAPGVKVVEGMIITVEKALTSWPPIVVTNALATSGDEVSTRPSECVVGERVEGSIGIVALFDDTSD